MKVHEYREMFRYLTRKPLSEKEIGMLYEADKQALAAPIQTPVASGEGRTGFKDAGLASNEPVKAGELLSYLKKYISLYRLK